MSNIPMINPVKTEDIIKAIRQKARIYTPEWKYDPAAPDGGAALAELFSFMFGETIDRLNRVPYKYYIEFLNLLDVSAQSMKPSTGMAVFKLSVGCDRSVPIKKGTQLYHDATDEKVSEEGRRIIFETEKDFTAVPAKITGMYSVNPRRDLIEKLDLELLPASFFNPSPDKNIQRHSFSIACRNVFMLKSPSEITLSMENTALGYLNEEYISRLSDPSFARWTYFDGSGQALFDRVFTKEGKLHLIKENNAPILPFELNKENTDTAGQLWITCDMTPDGRADEIVMNRISAGSAYLHKGKHGIHILPQHIYANDIAIDSEEGGYCFGKQPMSYDCFYISSEEVFSKKDARINIEFDLKTVVRQIGNVQETPQYNFNRKYIVEKTDLPVIAPDQVFISRIAWEYWNGAGWTHLKVEGDLNPFRGQEGSFKKQVSFTCPADMEKSLQNSIESYWIRVRVVEVENAFSIYANLLLPYVEAISLDFDYMGALKPVECVYTENNCDVAVYAGANPVTSMRLFEPMAENAHAVYLAFDLPPHGYPVNLYFKTEGQSKAGRVLNFEYLTRDVKGEGVWYELKHIDRTNGLEEDGIISIYAPLDFKKSTVFGEEAYWLRIVDRNMRFQDTLESYPVIQRIVPNVVDIVQRQTVTGEMFTAGLFESGKEITLANRPVLGCEAWVNEIGGISKAEMTALQEENPDYVEVKYDSSGHVSEFWVKWERCDTFADSGSSSRNYRLDGYTGKITFGDGRNGKVPSGGEESNIKVDYSFGGGRLGNLQDGSIDGLILSIPYVDTVTNMEMTCGGSDKHDIKTLERVGPQRLRHRNRAVTASDYESLILEQFPEIKDVKCVCNYDRLGQQARGHVTLVVMPYDIENRSFSLKLCRKVEQYLSELASCELLAGGRLSVVPAIVMKLNVTASVSVADYEIAAETEREVLEALADYLNPIASNTRQLKIEEIPVATDFYGLLKKIRNIASIQEVVLEGRYYDGNMLRVVPLDTAQKLKYMVVANGEHTVKIL